MCPKKINYSLFAVFSYLSVNHILSYQNRSQEFASRLTCLILHGIFLDFVDSYIDPYTNPATELCTVPFIETPKNYAVSGLDIKFYC